MLEVLVAFAILILALTVILRIYSSGTRSIALSDEYSRAIKLAESIVAASGRSDTLQPEEQRGVVNGEYRWVRYVGPAHELLQRDVLADRMDKEKQIESRIRTVEVEVSWESMGQSRSVVLRTIKPVLTK